MCYHNIVGLRAQALVAVESWPPRATAWCSVESAHVDDAVSEITVPADHTTIHAHPAAVLEVRRILLEHLADLRRAARVESIGPAGRRAK